MRSLLPVSAALLLALASSSLASVAAQSYTYSFAATTSAGVNGTISVKYATAAGTSATVTADLDFAGVKLTDLSATESSCTATPTEYAWHIHVLWPTSANVTAAAYSQCSKEIAGNHYDPLKACGPASEYAGTTNCTAEKTAAYSCTPTKYAANATVCEKGDLSGKFGKLAVNATTNKATGTWTDASYPLVAENTAQWNIVLHAVCGTATPRVACAVGTFAAAATTTPTPTPTPTPTTSAAYRSGAFSSVVVATSLLALLAAVL